jgi:hypothetical protein
MIIDINNYRENLFLSSTDQFLDGNVFFNTENKTVELGTKELHPTLDLSRKGLSSTHENSLSNIGGVTAQALYAFEISIRRSDEGELLRRHLRWTNCSPVGLKFDIPTTNETTLIIK